MLKISKLNQLNKGLFIALTLIIALGLLLHPIPAIAQGNQTSLTNIQTISYPLVHEALSGAAPPARIRDIFPDNTLARVVGFTLQDAGFWWITSTNDVVSQDELDAITRLSIDRIPPLEWVGEVQSLEGIQYLNNLSELKMSNQEIQDISILADLTQLYYVDLSYNPIADASPLANTGPISYLNLSGTLISNLDFLTSALYDYLAALYIANTQISDITALQPFLANLYALDLSGTQVSDISVLYGFNELVILDLFQTPVSDISVLDFDALSGLAHIGLSNISDTELQQLLNSREYGFNTLRLSNVDAQYLIPLVYLLPYLQNLQLYQSNIQDLSFVDELDYLQALILSHNQINNQVLNTLNSLPYMLLDLSYNNITNAGHLQNLWNENIYYYAFSLNISHNAISDLSFLQGETTPSMPYALAFDSVNISHNQISDLSPFLEFGTAGVGWAQTFHAAYFNLSNNQINDLAPIIQSFSESRINLSQLILSHNQIDSIAPLANFNHEWRIFHLNTLDLSHNQISDLSPLAEMAENLDMFGALRVNLSHNAIYDISPIGTLRNTIGFGWEFFHAIDLIVTDQIVTLDKILHNFTGVSAFDMYLEYPISTSGSAFDIYLENPVRSIEGDYVELSNISHGGILSTPEADFITWTDLPANTTELSWEFTHHEHFDITFCPYSACVRFSGTVIQPLEILIDELLVTFDLQGGNIGGNPNPVEEYVPYGTSGTDITLPPVPVKDGHNFLGWMTDDGTDITDWSEIVITENTTFYARWSDEFPVIFNLQGGNINGNTANHVVTVTYGTSLGDRMPPNPTRPSHAFIGWFDRPLTGGNQFTVTTVVYGEKIVYARWQATGGGGSRPGGGGDANNGGPIPPDVFSGNHEAYLVGFPDGTIRPNNTITRAEVATIFFRLLDDNYRTQVWSQSNPFRDVVLTNWFNNAASTLANADIVEGFPDGTFQGTQAITRAEFVTMVVRFLEDTSYTGSDRFNDISGHWAREYINAAGQYDWIRGFGSGDFRPNQNITRAEAAAIVNRMLERQPESAADLLPGMVTWPDNMNQNSWFYLYIQEATNSHDYEMKADGIHETWTELREPRNWTVLERPNSRPQDIL